MFALGWGEAVREERLGSGSAGCSGGRRRG